ncbi:MAG: N(4)-(beta-N-acetylglucosaminyl)-L-asparaginase [Bacteroidota bacterium]|nr:N(4)-(beta-N-acetylglucosaminyl)-L-asparaginase [Bacteroidota bacterium]
MKLGLAGSGAIVLGKGATAFEASAAPPQGAIILSTWSHGMPANKKAWEVLQNGGSVLDAVEQGVMVVESDFTNRSVGLGGLPDRDGKVTLDACIQDHDCRAGSVAFMQGFENPIKIARAVMERTPHVMLVGSGAERWALENGFVKKEIEIPEVRQRWQEWLKKSEYKPEMNIEEKLQDPKKGSKGSIDDHDTIGLIAMDANGKLAGACTTSGLAWKVHGRVGDSPIIGAGLYVDGEAGAACATGVGELVIRTAGSHTIVELMRNGMDPMEACREAVKRIIRKHPRMEDMQVGFLAIRADGAYGAYSIEKGFNFALRTKDADELVDATHEKH